MAKSNVLTEGAIFWHAELWGCHSVWRWAFPFRLSVTHVFGSHVHSAESDVRVEISEHNVHLLAFSLFLIHVPRHLQEVLGFYNSLNERKTSACHNTLIWQEYSAKAHVLNSCYRSCTHGQSLLCLQLLADEAKGSIQWKMTLEPRLCVETADNCDKSY